MFDDFDLYESCEEYYSDLDEWEIEMNRETEDYEEYLEDYRDERQP